MKIVEFDKKNGHKLTIKELVEGYLEGSAYEFDDSAVGLNNNLIIRPSYQREFVYSEDKKSKVIESVLNGYPLSIMYWVIRDDKTSYEVLDGQQRILSICEFYTGRFSVKIDGVDKYYSGLNNKQKDFLNYELLVFVCDGEWDEKIKWFETINIIGESLTEQEMKNAIHDSKFVMEAKKYFSKRNNCPAENLYGDYLSGSRERQKYLETALEWFVDFLNKDIENKDEKYTVDSYMSKKSEDENADELINYIESVFNWVINTLKLPTYVEKSDWNKIEYGILYNKFYENNINIKNLKERYKYIHQNVEVDFKHNIIEYILLGEKEKEHKRILNKRLFKENDKKIFWIKQNKLCNSCGKELEFKDAVGDHITPWSKGGETDKNNLQILCKSCNGIKSDN